MGKITIARADWSDMATIYPQSEKAEAPATNLQTMQPSEIWASDDLKTVYLDFDHVTPALFNQVSVLYSRASDTATWDILAGSTQGNGGALNVTGLAFGAQTGLSDYDRRHSLYWIPAGVTARWVRIKIYDESGPAYVEAARAYISNAWQPLRNVIYGSSVWGWEDTAEWLQAPHGAIHVTPGSSVKTMELQFKFTDEDDAYRLYEIIRRRGRSRDVLICLDPDSGATHRMRKMLYGLIERVSPAIEPSFNMWEITVEFRELI